MHIYIYIYDKRWMTPLWTQPTSDRRRHALIKLILGSAKFTKGAILRIFPVSTCQHPVKQLIYESLIADKKPHSGASRSYNHILLVGAVIGFNNIIFFFCAIVFLFFGMSMSIYKDALDKKYSSFSLYFFKYTKFLSICFIKFLAFLNGFWPFSV